MACGPAMPWPSTWRRRTRCGSTACLPCWTSPAAERPRFLTLYFDTVDTAGHDFGPDSPELNAAIGEVDGQIGRLVDGLKARGQAANLVVVADHGMAPLSPDRKLYMDDTLATAAYRTLSRGAFMSIYAAPGHEGEVASALLKAHAHFRCWAKANIPARYHYGKNPRVAPSSAWRTPGGR